MIREVYFLRHGETDMNRQFRIQGRVDVPLNDEGRRQLSEAAGYFSMVGLDHVISSPLCRAVESAELATKGKNIEIKRAEWLMEIDHGDAEGMTKDEVDAKFPGLHETWMNRPDEAVFPNGETIPEVADRVREGLLELMSTDYDGTALLVTHQIISGVARCILLGLPLSKVWENKLVNGDYFHYQITKELIHRTESFRVGV